MGCPIYLTHLYFMNNILCVQIKMANKWFVHLSKFRKEHPDMSLTDAMKAAKKTYHKVKGGAVTDPISGEASATSSAVSGSPTSGSEVPSPKTPTSTGPLQGAKRSKKGKTAGKKCGKKSKKTARRS